MAMAQKPNGFGQKCARTRCAQVDIANRKCVVYGNASALADFMNSIRKQGPSIFRPFLFYSALGTLASASALTPAATSTLSGAFRFFFITIMGAAEAAVDDDDEKEGIPGAEVGKDDAALPNAIGAADDDEEELPNPTVVADDEALPNPMVVTPDAGPADAATAPGAALP